MNSVEENVSRASNALKDERIDLVFDAVKNAIVLARSTSAGTSGEWPRMPSPELGQALMRAFTEIGNTDVEEGIVRFVQAVRDHFV